MRDYKKEFEGRVAFVKQLLKESGAKGIVFGNSGGKDSALVGIICKAACEDTVGVIMPCSSKRNYELDARDGETLAKQFNIETRVVDLSPVKEAMLSQLASATEVNKMADVNIAPRLRMTTLYAIAASEGRLVAGTGNRSEAYVGYFTKWGDGAHDFNPISDLTVKEIFEFLRYLDAPACILDKAPSAGLFDGQTDEDEMGFKYADLDELLLTGSTNEKAAAIIERMHRGSEHKRRPIRTYDKG
ncbi:MAG TPA: NAD(+) synthase [Candidatus Limivicinus faecipullorum]|nr:NAD(+) synthase [Candidatus Limivicinus faecipullorum]